MAKDSLANFLKNRRAKVDPASLGLSPTRRRTPGLRREEVAQRANVSVTWYTWLEQGRGGVPSSEVLEGIATALDLSPAEREHLFLLAQQRLPEMPVAQVPCVSAQLQQVLDSMPYSPAIVKTAWWDVVAWNQAALAVLTDYSAVPPEERNILRMLFCGSHARRQMPEWESHARFAVAVFRAETARAGAPKQAEQLVRELRKLSPEFEAMWLDHEVRNYGEGTKHLHHSIVGPISVHYSSFLVDGQPDLGLVIFTPATSADVESIRRLLEAKSGSSNA
ncbi:MAG: helix-turn-helix domain-containing protein [Armatimonadetes bacterium]|nr:helix-turn-helix domain-containing protein [Armatimonadota bacterium]